MKTIQMRKEDWQKWDKALRSGEYQQGKGFLEKDNKFCCLGVLQHCLTGSTQALELNEEGKPRLNPSKQWLREHHVKFLSSSGFSKEERESPYLEPLDTVACAANDDGRSFMEIADAIAESVEFVE